MIHALLRRNLTCSFSRNLSSPGKSRVSFSLSVLYFSTSRESKPLNNPAVYEFLLHKHSFSPVVASHVASVLTRFKYPEKCDSILSFFKEIGFTKSQLERTLNSRPRLLSANLERIIKPKIKIFQDMGFSANDISDIISKEPGILQSNANNRVIPRLALLKDLLGSNQQVAKALKKTGWLLTSDLEKTMVPNVEFLKSCGIPMGQITTICNHVPRIFLYKPEVVRKCVDQVDELGVDRSSKMFVYVVAVVASMTNGIWELKLQAFRNILQFSEDDILRAVRHSPQVFTVSEDKMKKVKEVVLGTGKYKTSCIVEWPKSLMFSIEQRYKPRFEVLRILESKHLIEDWPRLEKICIMSDDKFLEKFVYPYKNEVGDAYLARKLLNEKRGEALSVGLKNCDELNNYST